MNGFSWNNKETQDLRVVLLKLNHALEGKENLEV